MRPGLGFALEVQGDRLGIVVYAYAEDGEPEFYTAGGEFRLFPNPSEDPVSAVHAMQGTLYRSRGGFGLLSRQLHDGGGPPPEFANVPVGEIYVRVAYPYGAIIQIVVDEAQPGLPRGTVSRDVVRMSFGYPALGARPTYVSNGCWPDLRGDWVFADAIDKSAAPLRLTLDSLEERTPTDQTCDGPTVKIYRDSARGLTLNCRNSWRPEDHPGGVLTTSGCELRDANSQVILSFMLGSMALQRIQAKRGGLPPTSPRF